MKKIKEIIPFIFSSKIKTYATACIGFIISFVFIWHVISEYNWNQIINNFRIASPLYLFLALITFLLARLLLAYRWKILFVNIDLPLNTLFSVQNLADTINNISPIRIISEITQFGFLKIKHNIPSSVLITTLGFERFFDVLATTFLIITAILIQKNYHNELMPYLYATIGINVITVIAFISYMIFSKTNFYKKFNWLISLKNEVKLLLTKKKILIAVFCLSLTYFFLLSVSAYLIAKSINLTNINGNIIPFSMIILAILFALYIGTLIPSGVLAIGTFDTGIILILHSVFELDKNLILTYSILTHAIFYLTPALIVLFILPKIDYDRIRKKILEYLKTS